MGHQRTMRRFARWHIWLAWLAGVPILMWTVTGLVMTVRPIEQVRGEHLRKDLPTETLPSGAELVRVPPADDVVELVQRVRAEKLEFIATRADGSKVAWNLTDNRPGGARMADEARAIVAQRIVGGDRAAAVTEFTADDPPFDFRRPVAGYQVALEDGTHVYVEKATGDILAVRTQFWRVFDFMWGLHIMDLQTREDTSHPLLILFAALGVLASLLGCVLMFRRRRVPA